MPFEDTVRKSLNDLLPMRKKIASLGTLLSCSASKDFIKSVGHIAIVDDFLDNVPFSYRHCFMNKALKPSILGPDFFEPFGLPNSTHPVYVPPFHHRVLLARLIPLGSALRTRPLCRMPIVILMIVVQTRPDVRPRTRGIVVRIRVRNATVRVRIVVTTEDHTGLWGNPPL